uniref:hypothetical protein n=1 Tax=Picosynechococcus sp. (strain ATCC 27264 / PCC 7002 / PR-6) TaxID=32049 RepID=UPI0028F43FCF
REVLEDINQRNSRKIFTCLCCIQYLLDIIKPEHNFEQHLKRTFEMYPEIESKNLGFPKDWENQPLLK